MPPSRLIATAMVAGLFIVSQPAVVAGATYTVTQTTLDAWTANFHATVAALDAALSAMRPPPQDSNDFTADQKATIAAQEQSYATTEASLAGADCDAERGAWEAANLPDKTTLDKWEELERIPGATFVKDTKQRCYNGTAQVDSNNCANQLPEAECDAAFPVARNLPSGKDPPLRAITCEEESFREDALKCAKNCFLCCERGGNKCTDSVEDSFWCAQQSSLACEGSTLLAQIMVKKCPGTCGTCDRVVQLSQFAGVGGGGWLGYQGYGGCVDTADECRDPDTIALCYVPQLRETIVQICPKTCGRC